MGGSPSGTSCETELGVPSVTNAMMSRASLTFINSYLVDRRNDLPLK